MRYKSNGVKTARGILLFPTLLSFCGCQTAHDVAVGTFRVIDAPANYVRRHIDESSGTQSTTTATTSGTSDAVTPGRSVPVTASSRQPQQRQTTSPPKPTPSDTSRVAGETIAEKPKPSPSSVSRNVPTAPTQTQYPTAKAVPGKPGYVFSPFDSNGGYVDVNGFASGSKVKDPYSGKIFLVP